MISILIPVHNEELYLAECLDSILKQSYSNWELIAIDDFSTDKSLKILHLYASKDTRIKVFQNNKKGICPALKLALEKSSREFVTRMDADDLMHSQKLELMVNQLSNAGSQSLVTGWVEYFSETILGEGYTKYQNWLNDLTEQENNFAEIYKECVIPSPCWMVRKTDLIACGGFEEEVYPEDYDLCFRFYENNFNIQGINQVIHYWRDHPKRSSRTDANYADNRFLNLKVQYFTKLDYVQKKQLVVWGTGKKGKSIISKLLSENIKPIWVTDNEKKIGKEIYGLFPKHFSKIDKLENLQIIIAVAGPNDQHFIKKYLSNKNHQFFWFC